MHVKCYLCAQYPNIKADVIKFIRFVRSERLLVTSCHIKSRVLHAAQNHNHSNYVHHVGDATVLFDSAWDVRSRKEGIKCGMRSDCLCVMHMDRTKFISSTYISLYEPLIQQTNQSILQYCRKLGKCLNPWRTTAVMLMTQQLPCTNSYQNNPISKQKQN